VDQQSAFDIARTHSKGGAKATFIIKPINTLCCESSSFAQYYR
jgi:hypothetical protein